MAGAFAAGVEVSDCLDGGHDVVGEIYQGYNRAKRCIYENNAVCSSCVGLSGNFAIVVWNSFQAALPSSAFTVSFPIFPVMASPFKVSSLTLTLCIGVELNVESMVRGEDKAQLITETKAIAAIRRTRKRRFAIAPWLGIVGVFVREVLDRCGERSVAPQKIVSAFN